MNLCIIKGNLGKEVSVNSVNGKTVAKFSIAETKFWKQDGEKKEKTRWHNIQCWGKTAERCHKFLQKGDTIIVEGELEYSEYEKDGKKVFWTQITANNVHFIGLKAWAEKKSGSTVQHSDVQNEVPW